MRNETTHCADAVDLLREAADTVEREAKAADTLGRWVAWDNPTVATWIGRMDPLVGLALAAWLRSVADRCDEYPGARPHEQAEAVARAILRRPA